MRSGLLGLVLFVACAPTPPAVDAGSPDAGPRCEGVPTRLSQSQCVGVGTAGAPPCDSSAAAAISAHFGNCDAGPGILGHLSVGECGSLEVVRWVYGFPGDTYECFYPRDGGAPVGGINFSDHGVIVAGEIAECTTLAAPACRDGG